MPTPQEVANQLRELAGEIEANTQRVTLDIIRDNLGLVAALTAFWKPTIPVERVFTITQTVMLSNSKLGSQVIRYIPRFEVLDVVSYSDDDTWIKCTYHNPLLGDTTGWIQKRKTEPYHLCPGDITMENAFDPTIQRIYIPQDEPAPGARARQYLNLESIHGMGRSVHYNLCGPFCAAALKGRDVIPMLNLWCSLTPANFKIISQDQPMGLSQIESMLNLAVSYYTFSPATNPLSARMLKTYSDNGKMVVGVGIDRNGAIRPDGYIRHWVVILDVLPCDTGGFVRLYNPFQNREETVDFIDLWGSMFPGGAGSRVMYVKGQ